MEFFAGVTSAPGTLLEVTWHGEWVPVTAGDRAKIDRTESVFRPNPAGASNGNVDAAPGVIYSTRRLRESVDTE